MSKKKKLYKKAIYIILYEDEYFKDITYPGVKPNLYEISNYGTVRNKVTGKIKKQFIYKNYYRVKLANNPQMYNSKITNRSVNRLVAWEFCEGWSKEKNIVNHINTDTMDNYYQNLEWTTSKLNSIHGVTNGNIVKGEKHYLNVFTEDIVRKICELLENGYDNISIMKKFLFNKKSDNPQLYKLIDHLRHRRSWKYICEEYEY